MANREHEALVGRVRQAPNREWIEDYFDLVRDLLDHVGLTSDDPRLALTIPKARKLPVNINSRYVLTGLRPKRTSYRFIVGPEYVKESGLQNKVCWRFDPSKGEPPEEAPYMLRFDGPLNSFDFRDLRLPWLHAAQREAKRGYSSSYRRHHQHVFYEAVMNDKYRISLLDEAFGDA